MSPSTNCDNLIKGDESCKLVAYPDPGTGGDPWTIGWGHTGPFVYKSLVCTKAQADAWYLEDRALAEAKLRGRIGDIVILNQNQYDALVSFCYNVKLRAAEECHLLEYVRCGYLEKAAAEFPKWDHAGGIILAGLSKRRAQEQALFLAHG